MNGWKAINTIWELQDEQGHSTQSASDLANLATSHFKDIYKSPQFVNLVEVMRTVKLFPRFVEQEEALDLTREVTMGELEAILKWFKKDKSLGPDGWTIEFYIVFFYILSMDLLNVIKDCSRNARCLRPSTLPLLPLSPNQTTPPFSMTFGLYRSVITSIRLLPRSSLTTSNPFYLPIYPREICLPP